MRIFFVLSQFSLNLPALVPSGQRLGLASIGSDFFLFGLFLRSFPLSFSSFLFHPLPTHPPFRPFHLHFINLDTLLRPQTIFCQALTSACWFPTRFVRALATLVSRPGLRPVRHQYYEANRVVLRSSHRRTTRWFLSLPARESH